MNKFDMTSTPVGYQLDPKGTNNIFGIFVGTVMSTKDETQYMGRLQVYIPEFGGRPADKSSWITVNYASPFAGATPISDVKDSTQTDADTQKSYGFWMVPPDVGNQVLVCFPAGDIARGVWFACLFQTYMNQMVPALGSATSTAGIKEPVAEYNKVEAVKAGGVDLSNPKRVRWSPLADGLKTQGLDQDPRRGNSDTSARRESPSHVFGFSTPRGNSIHIDDGTGGDKPGDARDNEFIRLRTRSGVGITIHETDGFVYIVSKNGKSYVEVSDAGVNLYSESQVSLRTSSDYNITSDGDINIDAKGSLNIAANGHIAMGSPGPVYVSSGDALVMGSTNGSSINAGGDLLLTSKGVMGLGAGGNSIRQGAQIRDGENPPVAPVPLAPERHAMPDGPGGTETGSSIASGMPHHEPYSAGAQTGATGGGGPNATQTPLAQSADMMKRAAQVSGCVGGGVADLQRRHPDGTFVTYGYLMAVASRESSFDANAKARSGTAAGLFQFNDDTWAQYSAKANGGTALPNSGKFDPCTAARVAAEKAYEDGKTLQAKGIDPNATNLYTMHLMGSAGGLKALQNPNAIAAQMSPKAAASNPDVYYKNGTPLTNSQIVGNITSSVAGKTDAWTSFGKDQIAARKTTPSTT